LLVTYNTAKQRQTKAWFPFTCTRVFCACTQMCISIHFSNQPRAQQEEKRTKYKKKNNAL